MATSHSPNVESSPDGDRYSELILFAREIPDRLQRKIRSLEREVRRAYDRHLNLTDEVHSIRHATVQHFIKLDPTMDWQFDHFGGFWHEYGKRALQGILKTEQEREDEKMHREELDICGNIHVSGV